MHPGLAHVYLAEQSSLYAPSQPKDVLRDMRSGKFHLPKEDGLPEERIRDSPPRIAHGQMLLASTSLCPRCIGIALNGTR
jgi:hypothetical protein